MKFYPEWKEFVSKNFHKNPYPKKFVLIFTRPISPYYMDREKYSELLLESCSAVIKSFGKDVLVVVKPHPREDIQHLEKVLKKSEASVLISKIDSSVLALNALVSISFWTSAILSSFAFKVPSVEFYKEAENFRKVEPSGSAYKNLGFPSVDNQADLISFLKKVPSGKAYFPDKAFIEFNINSHIDFSNVLGRCS